MTQYVVRTSLEEADDIASGKKMFIFRDAALNFGYGDNIVFQPYHEQKQRPHRIQNMLFKVTYVSTDVPLEHGFKAVGFRRVS